jgi:hypothetical protein
MNTHKRKILRKVITLSALRESVEFAGAFQYILRVGLGEAPPMVTITAQFLPER